MKRCVLVVDDQPGTRRLVRNLLEASGYEVIEAGDEQSAWNAMRTLKADIGLALIDVELMGGISGPYLALGFRSFLNVPIVLMSGHPRAALLATHHLQASVPFVQKPFTLREMTDTIAAAWGTRAFPSSAAPTSDAVVQPDEHYQATLLPAMAQR